MPELYQLFRIKTNYDKDQLLYLSFFCLQVFSVFIG